MTSYQIMSMNMRIQPSIFVPREFPNLRLREVYLEQRHSQIDILWYYWPQDGWFIGTPDYEPIILIFSKENELEILAPRRGWKYEPTLGSDLHSPIEIIFGGIGGLAEPLTASYTIIIDVYPQVFW